MPTVKITRATLKRLKNIRICKKLSQEHLARGLGINRTTYIRKEQGTIPITTEQWLKIAAMLDEEPSYFFSSNHAGRTMVSIEETERLLLKLYRTLTPEEQQDMRNSLRLMLKGIKRKKVREAVGLLMGSIKQ
jgi:transcriptional regulator with XRE-family HTH domain